MGKKQKKAKLRISSLVCLILSVLMIVCVFLPVVTTSVSLGILSTSKTSSLDGHEFIGAMFKDSEKVDVSGNMDDKSQFDVLTIAAMKGSDSTKAGTTMIMIGITVVTLAALGAAVMGLLNILLPNGLFNLIMKICVVVAFVCALLALIGGFVLADNINPDVDLGILAKASASIGWGVIVLAIASLANAIVPFVVKK